MCEYDVIPDQVGQLARRDSRAAQRAFAALLSNCVDGDGFVAEFGEYDQALSIEIVGTDGRRVVVAPLLKWEQGDAFEPLWEWAMRGAGGRFVDFPGGQAPFECTTIWGAEEVGLDYTRGIQFYRRAVDEAHELTGFQPAAAGDAAHGFMAR